MIELNEVLTKIGFNEYKKKLYIALIELEKASVYQISKKANVPTSKSYEVLRDLEMENYITLIQSNPITYSANNPKSLLRTKIQNKIKFYKDIEQDIKKLETKIQNVNQGYFEIIQGRDPFFNKVKESVTKTNSSIIAIVKSWRMDKELLKLTRKVIENNGTVKFIGPYKNNKSRIKELNKIGIETKNYNPESTRFTVWDNKIITIGFKEKDYTSIWMENEFMGKILVEHFERLWKSI